MRMQKGKISKQELDHFKNRIDALDVKLKAHDRKEVLEESEKDKNQNQSKKIGQAFRVTADLVAGVLVGALIGYGLDGFFGTWPIAFILLLPLGFAAGMLTMMRSLGVISKGKWQIQRKILQNESKNNKKV